MFLFLLPSLVFFAETNETSCDLTLWVSDPDPNGLNVRAAPSIGADVLGTLPTSAEFTAIESQNGWIQFKNPISGPGDWEPLTAGPQTGWVHGSLVKTSLRHRSTEADKAGHFRLYASSSEDSETLHQWVAGQEAWSPGNDYHAVKRIWACKEGWLKVDLLDDQKTTLTGWVHPENQCPNQVTTCP